MQPKIYSVSDHDIDPNAIDPDALYVLRKLREAGFIAYLVGGAPRDLLLKRVPKDCDISTSALPEEIKQLFQRSCLLIGRRFRLAHIRFGHKIIEVSTFRSGDNEEELILRDNQWGTPEQDVLRRDFTINGLFYDPATHSIIDYVGGWEDIKQNTLRTIGVAETRFIQDPVRMIRLLKFRARFGFQIHPEAKKALLSCRKEILKSASARVLEEILRMLESGAAAPFFHLLQESNMLRMLYPHLAELFTGPSGKEILLYLSGADKLSQAAGKKTLNRPLLAACMIFPLVRKEVEAFIKAQGRIPHLGEIILIIGSTIHKFESGAFVRFPRRLMAIMSAILLLQFRLTPLTGKLHHHQKVMQSHDFADALALLKVRALIDKNLIEIYTGWKSAYRQTHHRTHHHQMPPRMTPAAHKTK